MDNPRYYDYHLISAIYFIIYTLGNKVYLASIIIEFFSKLEYYSCHGSCHHKMHVIHFIKMC